MLPPEPDVIAYDENMGVIFQWSGCAGVTELSELPKQGSAGIAIQMAHLIRRRDGLVLKGPDGDPMDVMGEEIVLPTEESKRKPRELKRVELIPPPEELAEHEPLSDIQMLKVALWVALMDGDNDALLIEDTDILQAMSGNLSIERNDGVVFVRAHYTGLAVISVADEAVRPRKRTQKKPSTGEDD